MTRILEKIPESYVLTECLSYLKDHPKVAWAVRMNTGAARLPGRRGNEQMVRFSFAGCSDIIGQLIDGRFLAVECKRPEYNAQGQKKNCREKLSERQVNFLELVDKNHGAAFVTDSWEDLEWFLDSLDRENDKDYSPDTISPESDENSLAA